MSLRHIILGLLKYQPFSGYDLKQTIDASTRHLWHCDLPQIYRALDANLQAGWVSVEADDASPRHRKLYSLTPAGEAALLDWLAEPLEVQPVRLPNLARLFFGRFAPLDQLRDQMHTYRSQLQARLSVYQTVQARLQNAEDLHPVDLKFWLITVDNGLRLTEASLAWCEQTLNTLAEIERMQA
ncbi:MAG: PadR family transcriptional regulator [Anaerolineae bacterium]|nr:PadR family transcriptional regulator [Anaerolineae bacterium]